MVTILKDFLALKEWRQHQSKLAFIPTMGALHDGHLALVKLAQEQAQQTLVSIFVNPKQFSPGEDFAEYPRTVEDDIEKLKAIGVDAVFLPTETVMYPEGFTMQIKMLSFDGFLDGASRPNFFTGIATVVARLLSNIQPDLAVFGEKDFQQLAMVRQLVKDLGLAVEILGCPIQRDTDGLALSSRNRRLDKTDRALAPMLYAMLSEVVASIHQDTKEIDEILATAIEKLNGTGFKVDYLECRQAQNLEQVKHWDQTTPARLFVAADLNGVRLIDNVPL